MTVLTDAQLTQVRQRPHRSRVFLSIFEPQTVAIYQIQIAHEKGENSLESGAWPVGDFNRVKSGMTAYISTSAGGRELGRIRIRTDATADTINLAENDIAWQNGWYLTVVDFFEPWSVYPRIILPDDNIPLFYKDWDIAYADQNLYMDPIPHMGPNHAAFLLQTPTGSYANVFYTASGSFDPTDAQPPTGYLWVFEGADPTASFYGEPGYVAYTGSGHFLTTLVTTTGFGKEFAGRRHVSIYERPDQGGNRPIVTWGLSSFEGNRDNGGYGLRLWVQELADRRKVTDGALVVLFTEDWEGGVETKQGGNAKNRTSILFNGYIEDGSISLDPTTSRVEFRAASITQRMKRLSGFSATLESKQVPGSWNELADLTVDKGIAHFLRWHSTVLAVADYFQTGNTLRANFIDFERASVFDGVQTLLDSALIGQFVADRQGAMYAEVVGNVIPTGSQRQFPTALSITRQDWLDEINIAFRPDEQMSYLELGGVAYSGPYTGTNDPFLAGAPGDAPAYFGGVERRSGLVLESQDQLNALVGLDFARRNARFPDIRLVMAGDYRNLDIAPQERVLVSLDPDENFRGYDWDEKPFWIESVRYDYESQNQVLLQSLVLHEETSGPPGDTVEIPVEPPFDSLDLEEWRLSLPIFPPILPPPIGPLPPPGNAQTVYYAFQTSIFRSRNFWTTTGTVQWEDLKPSFYNVTGSVEQFVLDPWDPLNTAYLQTYQSFGAVADSGPRIYRTFTLNEDTPTWVQIFGPSDADLLLGTNYAQRDFLDLRACINAPGVLFAAGINQQLGGGQPTKRPCRTTDYGTSWTESHAGCQPDNGGLGLRILPSPHVGGVGSMPVYMTDAGGRVYRSNDGGANWTSLGFPPTNKRVLTPHIPYNENGDDQGVLHVLEDTVNETGSYTAYSTDGMASRSPAGFNYGGEQWRLYSEISWAGRDMNGYQHPLDGKTYALLRNASDAFPFKTMFAVAGSPRPTTTNWIARFIDEGEIDGLCWNPANVDRWAAHQKGGGTKWPLATPVRTMDGARSTWRSALGNFNSVSTVGNYNTLALRQIGIVWTG